MNEPLSRYNVTVTVGCDGGSRPDPAAFAVAAEQAAWNRSASIISAHLADKIISVVTVAAPDRYAAAAVARAVVSDALKRQALSANQQTTAPTIARRFVVHRAPELPVVGFATATAADLRGCVMAAGARLWVARSSGFVVIGNRRSRSLMSRGTTWPRPYDRRG